MQRIIIIIGGGFAGVFAALAAAGERHRSKQGAGITVELLSPDPYLTIRPRLYEAELISARVPLACALEPVDVATHRAVVETIRPDKQIVNIRLPDGAKVTVGYDALVVATGSTASAPSGWAGESVENWPPAQRLRYRLDQVAQRTPRPAPGHSIAVIEDIVEMPSAAVAANLGTCNGATRKLAWRARCQRDRVRYPASRQDDWIMVQAEVDLSQLRYV